MKKIFLALIFLTSLSCGRNDGTEQNGNEAGISSEEISTKGASAMEQQLYQLIMQYRKEKGLAAIPYSKNLSIVAQTHTKDLVENQPNKGNCNLHSWSNKGKWKPVCYTNDHTQAALMWSKPRELTSYQANGYEISAMSSGNISAKTALDLWKTSKGHNDVILNLDLWKGRQWKAIGIGIYKGHASVWFGEVTDQ